MWLAMNVENESFVCTNKPTNNAHNAEKDYYLTSMQLIVVEFSIFETEKLAKYMWGAKLSHCVHAMITPSFE